MVIKDIYSLFDKSDCLMILEKLYKYSFSDSIIHSNDEINGNDEKIILEYKRLYDEDIPIEYILGFKYFYNRKFYTDPDVLIPRFDTEILVDEIIKTNRKFDNILEIGIGSGIISITLNLELDSKVLGVDINKKAIELSKKNAESLNATDVEFIYSDLYENVNSKYDLIVSNPPYIDKKDFDSLETKILKEPRSALFGGHDGLYFYRKIINKAGDYLNEDGMLAFEIGYNQRESIFEILDENGFENHYCIKDFNGFNRVIIARR